MEQLSPGDPREVGPYRLLKRLGEGGMGRVFLARTPTGRRVSGLHTAQVVDADPDADPPWLATAYIDGPSLQELVHDRGRLVGEALHDLAAGVAEGLAAIHEAGLVHRDLKPGNVIMAPDGPRIIDFGVARSVDSSTLTETGTVLGTYAFMAPEQIRADRAEPAADVFALGCVLVYAATGRSPFDASTIPGIVHRVLTEDPDLHALPDGLRELAFDCLDKDPGRRPGAVDVLEWLAATAVAADPVVDETATAPPVDATRPWPEGETAAVIPVRQRFSRRGLLWGGLAVAGVVGASAVTLPRLVSDAKPPERETGRLVTEGSFDEVRTAVFSPGDNQVAALVANDTESYIQVWNVATEFRLRRFGAEGIADTIAFSPDGELLASGGRIVRLWNLSSGRETLNHEFGGPAVSLAFNPEGTLLAVGTDNGLSVWDIITQEFRTLHYRAIDAVAFSPDGEFIAGLGPHDSGIWRVDDGDRDDELSGLSSPGRLAFGPDGRTIIAALGGTTGSEESGLWVWQVGDGSKRRVADTALDQAAFHPDGDSVATSQRSGIELCDLATGRTTVTFAEDEARSLSFDRDGTILAAVLVNAAERVTLYRVE